MRTDLFQYEGLDIRIENASLTGENLVSLKKPAITKEMLEDSLKPIMNFGKKIIDEAIALAPNEVSIEFGLDMGFESGNLCWGIAKGSASTHFNITMTWKSYNT